MVKFLDHLYFLEYKSVLSEVKILIQVEICSLGAYQS